MSMRSRKEGQRRPGVVKMAAVFTGTLMVYLFVTAIPALAVASSCARAGATEELVVTVGTDDTVVLGVGATLGLTAATFGWSLNGAVFVDCAGVAPTEGNIAWVHVVGQNDGAEKFTLFHADGDGVGDDIVTANNVTVDLGNGSDTLTLEYGALAAPVYADAAGINTLTLGTSDDGTNDGLPVISANAGVSGDVLVTDAETINVNTGGGNDVVDAGVTVAIVATSVIADPQTGDNVPGASIGSALAVNFTFNAGAGNDTLTSGDGADNFQGGAGDDAISYAGSPVGVTADLTAATGTGQGNDILSDIQDVTGSAFDDTITGSSLDNTIAGGAGDDVIDGGAGDDTITGDAGDDTFNEGAADNGSDTLTGGASVVGDTLNYGDRTTAIVITAGGGAVSGASGELDTIVSGFEFYITGSGDDTLTGDAGAESFNPGSGLNTVDGGAGVDDLDLSSQTGPAAIVLSGGEGTATAGTTVDTYTGIESFTGTSAGDTLTWDGTGALLAFNGGAGTDSIDASSATGAVVIVLPATTENATGGAGGDTLTGNVLNNRLLGNAGADTINGLGGNDRIEGGVGNDALNTGAGNTGADTLVYVHADAAEDIDNQLGFATGGDGNDSIGFFAIIKGSDFGDTMRAGQNSVNFNQRLYGRGGADDLVGSNSSDWLRGGSGNDTLRAAGGDDDLWGGAGADLLVGGRGFDFGRGGNGNDSCRGVERERSC